ncbi:hypothetical protein [Actinomadura sp. WAC 06369]|uniref:hypothetical protein n=1 Tax=Actinomadura sp. WAC 06369 TaxID=2203193 RepID=UPI000F787566|nr:hypothetical protein [Actinomadura sp. WAC 06369]
MPGKHTRAAIKELEEAGWQITYTQGHAHAYARAACPDGPECCSPPFSINGSPASDENQAKQIRKKMLRHEAQAEARREGENG